MDTMTKEAVLSTFKEILSKSGMEEVVSLSENTNELADIMIYQEHGAPEYLALNGKPLFPIWEIKNILYRFGEAEVYNYVGSELQFVIELKGDACYILEFGNNGICDAMHFNGDWVTEDEKIKAALVQYNQIISKRDNVQCLVYSVAGIIEAKDNIADSELREVQEEINRYIKENPDDEDFLLFYAYSLLQMFVYEDTDLFDIKNIVRRLVSDGRSAEFIDYIRRDNTDSDGAIFNDGYYLSLVAAALRMIREIREEESVE